MPPIAFTPYGMHKATNDLQPVKSGHLSVAEFREYSEVISDDVYPQLQIDNILKKRNIIGGVALEQTAKEIEMLKSSLANRK